ncbi:MULTISPECIES: 16S rRNA (adenine(1518)-N(6)/adenine(1519)-N(6))-dimethyltransferase RsmA [unclassified Mycobacterium]|uniref:16S rRNA (adenine(1518)-N(6)/adenine(1519)-N(6))- dimethyltransferase RsmA n=1 Tax=unclassified Mycobacterium TaxID=2642494 RepID=UPI0006DC3E67|nr:MULTISPECIES: 16S rRNA (adenine(1518)-N(6)/adenine(1519)-N(6))-dimethyltransferase RsmA [unclassified Mycobacterium]OBH83700.1 16S rRNA (adenine(1518)-N(6)/adenine(1519)-N(6))-dimethyltransferase [Mycobacterium sp. E2989]
MAGVQRKSWCELTVRLLGRTEIRRLAKELDFRPRKSLGQNFVHDANTVRRIVSTSGVGRSDHVLEVGPGLGSLTLALLERGATVTAVEIDPVLAERLPQTVAERSHSESQRLTVVNRDVLTLRGDELAAQPNAVVANLPYNVAVPALLHLLAEFPSIRTVTVMVQAEVAERLAAEPGGKDYGVPSVKVRFFGTVRRCGMVSPTVFWPIPRVYSGLVRIDRYAAAPWPTDEAFRRQVFQLVDIAFAQRRKTARNAFIEWAGSGSESANRLLAASIDPARRGETLSIDDFVRLLRRSTGSAGTTPPAAQQQPSPS